MEELLTILLAQDLATMRPGERFEVEISDQFKAHVTWALRHQWFRVNDRVGWVNTNPLPMIEEAVAKKSELPNTYREAAGADIHLLLVANRMFASGKLQLVEDSTMDTQGFRVVYFFSYPETVPIRLSPIPTTSRVLPIPRVKLGLGRAAISPAMSSAS